MSTRTSCMFARISRNFTSTSWLADRKLVGIEDVDLLEGKMRVRVVLVVSSELSVFLFCRRFMNKSLIQVELST